MHRPVTDWEKMARRADPGAIEGRIFQGLAKLVALRKSTPALANGELQVIATDNPHVLGYVRTAGEQRVLVFANFSEQPQTIPANLLRLYGLTYQFNDLAAGQQAHSGDLALAPFGFACLGA